MKDLSVKFNLNNLSWTVVEEDQEGAIISKAYFKITQEHQTRSYENVSFGVDVIIDGKNVQHEEFTETVDVSIPTQLDINKTIPLLLQSEKVHEIIFWVDVGDGRHTYSYVTSTVTPLEPILVPDYELN